MSEFISLKYNRADINLDEIKLPFLIEFQHHMSIVEGNSHNTSMKHANDIKQFFKFAVAMEYLEKDPFISFNCTYKKVKRDFLDEAELIALYNKKFQIKRLEEVRDCYLFSCYTGYAYTDAQALTLADVLVGIDGTKWIIKDRKKTDTTENVPLLPIALEIIEKYKNHPYCITNNKLLPINSNQKYNAYLKDVADLCGIEKKLNHPHSTTHICNNCIISQ